MMHDGSDTKKSKIEELIGDLGTFDTILSNVLRNWGGQGTTIPLDNPQYLFHDSETFSPLCKFVQQLDGGSNFCWQHDLNVSKQAGIEKKSIESICDCGLIGVVVPIIVNGVAIAAILFGQRRKTGDEDFDKEAIEKLEKMETNLGVKKGTLISLWKEVPEVNNEQIENAKKDVSRIASFIGEILTEREILELKSKRLALLEQEYEKLTIPYLDTEKPIDSYWNKLSEVFSNIASILVVQKGFLLRGDPINESKFNIYTSFPINENNLEIEVIFPRLHWDELVDHGLFFGSIDEFKKEYSDLPESVCIEMGDLLDSEVALIPILMDDLEEVRTALLFISKSIDPKNVYVNDEIPLPFSKQLDIFQTIATRFSSLFGSSMRYYEKIVLEEEKDQYIQDVAHQLIGPLSGIRAHCENLLRGRLSIERGKNVLETLVEQSGMLQRYAVNYGLAARGRSTIFQPSEIDLIQYDEQQLVQLLISCVKSFQGEAKEKGLIGPHVDEVSFRGFPDVLLDTDLIEILIMGLVDNAIKYSYETSPIEIVGREYSDKIELEFISHGIPLDEREIDIIFQRGTRTSSAEEFNKVGTGIGLFICDQITKVHKGSIRTSPSTKSIYGNEVHFVVSLPISKKKENEEEEK